MLDSAFKSDYIFLVVKPIIDIANFVLPVCYTLTVWSYAKAFFSDSLLHKKLNTPFLLVTALGHISYLLARTWQFGHPPITTIPEIMTLIAFSITAAYIVIEYRTGVKNTGYFIMILAFLFQLGASLFIQDLVVVNPVLRSNLLGIHVLSALLGYTAIAISAVYALLYLMLYHNMKSSRFGAIYSKLPNLETLERLSFVSIALGFVLLSIAIVVGFIWLPKAFGDFSYFDPKLIGTITIWVLYAVGLFTKKTLGWQGRRMMLLSIAGFLISFFSLTIVNVFFSGFHNFF